MIYLITLALSAIFITQGVKLLMDEQLEMLKLYLAIYSSEKVLGVQHMHTMEDISRVFERDVKEIWRLYEHLDDSVQEKWIPLSRRDG